MNEENKFLSRSRERVKWKKKLAIKPKKETKADSIYFRPSLSDDKRIRELAELTGETTNAIVEKLVCLALSNKTFTTQKLDEQKTALLRVEDRTEDIADNQLEIINLLEEIRSGHTTADALTTSLLSEIYCMAHTAVSLLRTALLQILNITQKNAPPAAEVLASFDETSDLTIARSLQDFETACRHHQIKNGRIPSENLFWQSKLRKTNSEPEQNNS
ncbi:MAG: hypothetical protein WKF90_02645 [Pyrinomonadaceae bacterium]